MSTHPSVPRAAESVADVRRADLLRLGLLALAVRVVAATVVSVGLAVTHRAALFPDEKIFLREAEAIGNGADFTGHGYANVLGLLFRLTGPSAWLPRAINVVAGAALALVVYELVLGLAGRRAARLAGYAVALWPTLVLWSVAVLKDPLLSLAAFLVLYGATRAFAGHPSGALLALPPLVLLEVLRPWAFALASLAIGAGFVVHLFMTGLRPAKSAALFVLAASLIGVIAGEGLLATRFLAGRSVAEAVDFARTESSAPAATGCSYDRTGGLIDTVRQAPKGLACSLLGPLPWQPRELAARLVLVMELPLWYGALVAAVVALVRLGWEAVRRWSVVLVFALGVIAVLAVYERNAGTALRQRAMVIPVVIALAASGRSMP